jgi:myo-inositol-1(or 4)-monophosphatase
LAAFDLALIEAAAREAGALALARRGTGYKTWSKGAAGPVTEVDLAIDALLKERLLEARPDYGWLSEETPDNPERLKHAAVFVIDPIDGTQAFIQGAPEFTISIGIVKDGVAWAGAIYNPSTDEMFLGARGSGATYNGAPVSTSTTSELEHAHLIGKEEFFAASKRWPEPWPILRLGFRQSIAYRLGLVANGHFDGVILAGMKHDWDIAAGVAIVCAAGGAVSDTQGAPLVFNKPDPRAPGVVAAGALLHPLLIERTAQLPDPRQGAKIKQEAPS